MKVRGRKLEKERNGVREKDNVSEMKRQGQEIEKFKSKK